MEKVYVVPATTAPYNSNPGYSNNPVYPRPVEIGPSSGCFERNQKNKPQSNSAGAAATLFISGGMNIAWSVGFPSYIAIELTLHIRICWFIAAIIGALFAAIICNQIQKKVLYLSSAILVTLGGILFSSLSGNYAAICAARYFDGFANGVALVITLVMAGEEAVKTMRGVISSSIEAMCFALGFYLQVIYATTWADVYQTSFNATQMHGILSIIYGIVSFVIAFFLVIESPIYFLVRGQEEQAIDALRRLQNPFVVTTETYEQFEEHKRYIAINKEMSWGESAAVGLPALIKLIIYRGLCTMTISYLVSFAIIISSTISQGYNPIWTYIIYATLRWIGVTITSFLMDTVGRKRPTLLGALICGGLAIGIGVIFDSPWNLFSRSKMETAMILIYIFQFFAGVFIAASSAYLSEAFPLGVKAFYIAIAFSVEMLVQIIICSIHMTYSGLPDYFFTMGSLLLVFFLVGIFCLPETKYTTLRESQELFRKLR